MGLQTPRSHRAAKSAKVFYQTNNISKRVAQVLNKPVNMPFPGPDCPATIVELFLVANSVYELDKGLL